MAERGYPSACKCSCLVGLLLLAQAAWAEGECDCRQSSPSKDVPAGNVKSSPQFDFSWRSRAGKSGGADCVERVVTNKNSRALFYKWELAGMRNNSLPPSEADVRCRPSGPAREPIESGPLLYGRSDTKSVTTQVWKSTDEALQASLAKAEAFSETLKVAFEVDKKVYRHTVIVVSSVKREEDSGDYTYDYMLRSAEGVGEPPTVRWGILATLGPGAVANNPSIREQETKTTDGSTAIILKKPISVSIRVRRPPITVENWVTFFSSNGDEMASMRTIGFAPK